MRRAIIGFGLAIVLYVLFCLALPRMCGANASPAVDDSQFAEPYSVPDGMKADAGDITHGFAQKFIAASRERGTDKVKFVEITSNGGFLGEMKEVSDYMATETKLNGTKWVCIVTSHAYSAAFYLFATACQERYITPAARVMWHCVRWNLRGTWTLDEIVQLAEQGYEMQAVLNADIVKATGMTPKEWGPLYSLELQFDGRDLAARTKKSKFVRLVREADDIDGYSNPIVFTKISKE